MGGEHQQSLDKHNEEGSLSLSYRLKAGIFLTVTGGFAALCGFGRALATARKSEGLLSMKLFWNCRDVILMFLLDPTQLSENARLHQAGVRLATRALALGTVYAVTGCAALFYSIWKLSGAQDLDEFRHKAGSILPRIPKSSNPQGRTEFEGLTDFVTYIVEEDERQKKLKKARSSTDL